MQYYDCSSESLSYNIMGIATINYTIISDNDSPTISSTFEIGGTVFKGVVTTYNTQIIQKSEHGNSTWYTTNVTLVATT